MKIWPLQLPCLTVIEMVIVQHGASKIAKLPYKWLNYGFIVDITIVKRVYYKPTYAWGAASCVKTCKWETRTLARKKSANIEVSDGTFPNIDAPFSGCAT